MTSLLIVDDNAGDIELMRTAMCEIDGTVQVFAVPSGVQALAFLTREGGFSAMPTPDLVLLDINMPGISGFQVLRVIRDIPAWSAVHVVMWSSSRRTEDGEAAAAGGAGEFVVKPGTWDQTVAFARHLRRLLPEHGDCSDHA